MSGHIVIRRKRVTDIADASALNHSLTEKEWSQVVVDYARLTGWQVYRTWNSIHSPPGFPDLCMARGPRLVFAELKTERGKLSPAQIAWLDTLAAVPGIEVYRTWRPSNWETVRDALL